MANPTALEMIFDVTRSADATGATRDFWMRFPGLRGASDQDAGGNDDIYYLENPLARDLVVLQALAVITTASGNDGDIDIGLADDATGTNVGKEICDSLVDSSAGVLELMPTQAITGVSRPTWKAKGTSTDAFLTITQNADADASALRWTLMLRVVPYNDLINSNVDLGTIAVA